MAVMSQENVKRAFEGLINEDTGESKIIASVEDDIDEMTRALASYLIKVSSATMSAAHETHVGRLHHVINDIERIGDYAVLLAKETNYMKHWDTHFMAITEEELRQIYSILMEMFELALYSFQSRKTDQLETIAEQQAEIKKLITFTRDVHITRLNSNMYSVEVSKSLYSVLFSLERAADHVVNIAFSIRSDTGSKTEAFEILKRDPR